MPKLIISFFFISLISCYSNKRVSNGYPDCNSNDIELMDTCLIGKPLRIAVEKLKLDTSKFFLFDEPPGILRGIFVFGIDSMKIRIYTERLSIMDSSGIINYDTPKTILKDKIITGVSWRKPNSRKERIIGQRISYWGF